MKDVQVVLLAAGFANGANRENFVMYLPSHAALSAPKYYFFAQLLVLLAPKSIFSSLNLREAARPMQRRRILIAPAREARTIIRPGANREAPSCRQPRSTNDPSVFLSEERARSVCTTSRHPESNDGVAARLLIQRRNVDALLVPSSFLPRVSYHDI